jgi:hypothetical protein
MANFTFFIATSVECSKAIDFAPKSTPLVAQDFPQENECATSSAQGVQWANALSGLADSAYICPITLEDAILSAP